MSESPITTQDPLVLRLQGMIVSAIEQEQMQALRLAEKLATAIRCKHATAQHDVEPRRVYFGMVSFSCVLVVLHVPGKARLVDLMFDLDTRGRDDIAEAFRKYVDDLFEDVLLP